MDDSKIKGIVFNIQKYSIHDGPGIRTLVFLKGCPLRCVWCCNPESQAPVVELGYNRNKCISLSECARCVMVCPQNAFTRGEDDKVRVNRNLCNGCMSCTQVCPAKALAPYGETKSVDEVLNAVEQDAVFYSRSGGGMTLSGGEPLLQAEFSLAMLREAKRRRLRTAVETCGHVRLDVLEAACDLVGTLLFDIKTLNPEKHKAVTGVSNDIILHNFQQVARRFPKLSICARTPVIPGVNDSEQDIRAIVDFLKAHVVTSYELLPYHRLGTQKYEYLGRDCTLDGEKRLNEETFLRLRSVVDYFFAPGAGSRSRG